MQRHGEYGRIVVKNRGGAVPLVDVAIDHRCASNAAVAPKHARGHGDVVEHAVTLAAIAERVMRPARQVDAYDPRCQPGGPTRSARPRASRRPTAATRSTISRRPPGNRCALRSAAGRRCRPATRDRRVSAIRAPDVRSSHARDGTAGSSARATLLDQLFRQQPVLRHRKPMLLRQRQHERVGVEGLHEICNLPRDQFANYRARTRPASRCASSWTAFRRRAARRCSTSASG